MFRLQRIERDTASRQRGVAAAVIAGIVRRAFGQATKLLHAEEMGVGTVNSTYRLSSNGGEQCILRVGPARAAAAAGPAWLLPDTLQREYALTPYFAPIAPLLPKTLVADFTHQLIDRDWVIQTVVPGQPWSEVAGVWTDAENASLWRQLGAITRQIHAVTGPAYGPLPPGRSFPRWSELLAHDSDGLVADFARFDLPVPPVRRLQEIVAEGADVLDAAGGPPRLIHSDLDQRHVFVRRNAGGLPVISGLIDHEFGRFADPLSESLLLTLPERPEAAPFFDTYGPLPNDEASHWRARLYRAIALGWTAGDQAQQGQETTAVVAAFAHMVRNLMIGQ